MEYFQEIGKKLPTIGNKTRNFLSSAVSGLTQLFTTAVPLVAADSDLVSLDFESYDWNRFGQMTKSFWACGCPLSEK